MNSTLLSVLALFALLSVVLASTAPFTCYYPIKVSCLSSNKSCDPTESCTNSLSNTVTCDFCNPQSLACFPIDGSTTSGLCTPLPSYGSVCGDSTGTNTQQLGECWDNKKDGYVVSCVATGGNTNNAVCTGNNPFSAGESGCSTSNYNAVTGGCDYNQTCSSGVCTKVTGSNTCSIDGDCGPSSYCQASTATCQGRIAAGGDCTSNHNGCAFNAVAMLSVDGSTCTCTALFSVGTGGFCNSPYVCQSGFCNNSISAPVCASKSGLNSGKSCTSDADCVVTTESNYFPQCGCGSGSRGTVNKGQCDYLGYTSSEIAQIKAFANCETNGNVDYGLRTDATHNEFDTTFDDFLDGVYNFPGGSFTHYYPGTPVDQQCGGTLRKYLTSACGSAASTFQILSSLFALAIAVALLF